MMTMNIIDVINDVITKYLLPKKVFHFGHSQYLNNF